MVRAERKQLKTTPQREDSFHSSIKLLDPLRSKLVLFYIGQRLLHCTKRQKALLAAGSCTSFS